MAFAQNGETSLYYELSGTGEELLVLSSGMGGGGEYWRSLLPRLTPHYRVAIYDQAGTARSGPPPQPQSIADMAMDLAAVIQACGGGAAHVVGHAVGGIIGLQLALMAPQTVASLTMINSWARPDPHLLRCFSVRRKVLQALGPRAYLEAQPIFLYPATWSSQHAADLDRHAERALQDWMPTEQLLHRIDTFLAFDPGADALASLTVPVLCLASHDDMLVPWTASRDLAARLGNGRLRCVGWGGHALNECAPDSFLAELGAFHNQSKVEMAP